MFLVRDKICLPAASCILRFREGSTIKTFASVYFLRWPQEFEFPKVGFMGSKHLHKTCTRIGAMNFH